MTSEDILEIQSTNKTKTSTFWNISVRKAVIGTVIGLTLAALALYAFLVSKTSLDTLSASSADTHASNHSSIDTSTTITSTDIPTDTSTDTPTNTSSETLTASNTINAGKKKKLMK